jgi:hypothetical protein
VNTVVDRTLTAGSSKVSISNATGVAGNPTVDVVPANFTGIPTSGVAFTSPAQFVFTTNGTFTSANAGTAQYLRILCQNGGAGAGGTAATVSQAAVSGAGGGGAYAERIIATAGLTFPLQVNVGAGGSGGAAGNNAGTQGGQSSVKDNNGAGATLCTPGVHNANQAGQGGAATTNQGACGLEGYDTTTTGGVGDFVIFGSPAAKGVLYGAGAANGTNGGASMLGFGGYSGVAASGRAGLGAGAGGGGSASVGIVAAVAGASGAAGAVIIQPLY